MPCRPSHEKPKWPAHVACSRRPAARWLHTDAQPSYSPSTPQGPRATLHDTTTPLSLSHACWVLHLCLSLSPRQHAPIDSSQPPAHGPLAALPAACTTTLPPAPPPARSPPSPRWRPSLSTGARPAHPCRRHEGSRVSPPTPADGHIHEVQAKRTKKAQARTQKKTRRPQSPAAVLRWPRRTGTCSPCTPRRPRWGSQSPNWRRCTPGRAPRAPPRRCRRRSARRGSPCPSCAWPGP